MRLNPYAQIEKIMRELKKNNAGLEKEEYIFDDGTSIDMYPNEVFAMFESMIEGEPNENARFFIEKFDKGIYDKNGFTHLVNAYNPAKMDEIWSGEDGS